MTTTAKNILNVLWFIGVYLLIQFFATVIVGMAFLLSRGLSMAEAITTFQNGFPMDPTAIIALTVVSNTLVILLFVICKWTPISLNYLRSKPWGTLMWVILLGLVTFVPSIWMVEWIDVDVPDDIDKMLNTLLGDGFGYLAIGVLAPIAEEILFRGAILRCLLALFSQRLHWLAILLSAIIFGLAHGNMAQAPHAMMLGLLFGWMYYRTRSIIPSLVLHSVNNSIICALYAFVPGVNDLKLIDLFGGNAQTMWICIALSLLLTIPLLLQLARKLNRHQA